LDSLTYISSSSRLTYEENLPLILHSGFLANNFNPESQADVEDTSKPMDQLVLFGFSRGAFTARAISSLITDIGLLTKVGMESFWGIFGDWMKQNIAGSQSEVISHRLRSLSKLRFIIFGFYSLNGADSL